MTPDEFRAEAQAALEELLAENRLPFKLMVVDVFGVGRSLYTIRFYGRPLSVTVLWEEGQSFKELVRAAVLERAGSGAV